MEITNADFKKLVRAVETGDLPFLRLNEEKLLKLSPGFQEKLLVASLENHKYSIASFFLCIGISPRVLSQKFVGEFFVLKDPKTLEDAVNIADQMAQDAFKNSPSSPKPSPGRTR